MLACLRVEKNSCIQKVSDQVKLLKPKVFVTDFSSITRKFLPTFLPFPSALFGRSILSILSAYFCRENGVFKVVSAKFSPGSSGDKLDSIDLFFIFTLADIAQFR
jgi:hypothetical protein